MSNMDALTLYAHTYWLASIYPQFQACSNFWYLALFDARNQCLLATTVDYFRETSDMKISRSELNVL